MRRPRVRVALGPPEDQPGDLLIVPGRRDADVGPSVATIAAPRWKPPSGPEHRLAEAYRHAVVVANERRARSLVLPAALVLGSWPMSDVTRVALTVLMSTPSTVREVTIAVQTPAMLEVWAEALAREP
jgi:hypothetical protein